MKSQEELAIKIKEDMESMGYKIIPDFSKVGELLDIEKFTEPMKKGYYQNLTKRALEIEFDTLINKFFQKEN
jgi:hypothetical protein